MPTPNEFSRIDLGSSQESYRTHSEETAGESGQVDPSLTYPAMPSELVPTEGEPKQWQVSSDVSGDPRDLARETDDSQNAFAELQQFLNNNLQTAGSRVCNDQTNRIDRPTGQRASEAKNQDGREETRAYPGARRGRTARGTKKRGTKTGTKIYHSNRTAEPRRETVNRCSDQWKGRGCPQHAGLGSSRPSFQRKHPTNHIGWRKGREQLGWEDLIHFSGAAIPPNRSPRPILRKRPLLQPIWAASRVGQPQPHSRVAHPQEPQPPASGSTE